MSDQAHTTANGGADSPPPEGGDTAPRLDESIRQVGQAGRATVDSAKHTLRSLRRLASADFALARSAFGRALAWSGVAIVFGASAWLLLAGTLIALMQHWGLSWFQSLLITSILSLAVTGYAIWRVSFFFRHTGMHATRRQLSRLGLYDEPTDDDPDAHVGRAEGTP
ncbi:phage holin family protein [Stenotrophomonas sp. GZD-301]|uniref:phage holin family protein n=1 Tax=Stenotrophomonas sp. GZD-301 TaxID=3404814 RepID=UPI003BB6C7F0